MIPKNASLFHCEWRVLLSPECPYVSSLQKVSEAGYIFLWTATCLLALQLLIRRFWWGLRIFQKDHYLKLNPIELIFFSSFNHVLWRAVQFTMLLYWKDSSVAPIVLTFFLSLSYFCGGACIIYYWTALIAALPVESIEGAGPYIRRLISINRVAAILFFSCVSLTLVLETCSSAYIFTNQKVYDTLLTIVYFQWVLVMFSMFVGVSWYGGKVKKMIQNTISTHENHSLKKTLLSMKLGVFLITNLCFSMFLVTLMMATSRYYVWSVPWFSTAVYVVHALSPAITCTAFCTILFIRDTLYKIRKVDQAKVTALSRGSQKESFHESHSFKVEQRAHEMM